MRRQGAAHAAAVEQRIVVPGEVVIAQVVRELAVGVARDA
ncbi:hypothetical protein JOD67_007050 [Tenggerimyces flavus]|nr:hypothetical protein [Tenggerimyces flavus]